MQASAGLGGAVWYRGKKSYSKGKKRKKEMLRGRIKKRQWALERKRWDN